MTSRASGDRADQARRALARASATRKRLARLRRQLRSGALPVERVLRASPAGLDALPTWEVLCHAPRAGPEAVAGLNAAAMVAGIILALPLGQLDRHQREWLIEAARDKRRGTGGSAPDYRAVSLQLEGAIAKHRERVYTAEVPDWASADQALYAAWRAARHLLGLPPASPGEGA